MSGESCKLCPLVRDKDGYLADSELFRGLTTYVKEDTHTLPMRRRKKVKSLYKLAKDPKFLEMVKDRVEFDEYGEITLNSFLGVLGDQANEKGVIKVLNDSIESGDYDYDTAVSKAQAFNSGLNYSKKYMATITKNEGETNPDRMYYVHIVKRTDKNERKFIKEIKDVSITEHLTALFRARGIEPTFITEGKSSFGPLEELDHTYTLVRILEGDDVDVELAYQSGLFAVEATYDMNNTKRLLDNLSDPTVQKAVLGEELFDKYAVGTVTDKEDNRAVPVEVAAGILIGKNLLNQYKPKDSIGRRFINLLDRCCANIKNLFSGMESKYLYNMRKLIDKDVETIATGYLSPTFQGTGDSVLQNQLDFFNRRYSKYVAAFNHSYARLDRLCKELEAINSPLKDYFGTILASMSTLGIKSEVGNPKSISGFVDANALVGLALIVKGITNELGTELIQRLDSVDPEKSTYIAENEMVEHARSLREARSILIHCTAIMSQVEALMVSNDGAPLTPDRLKSILGLDPDTNQLVTYNFDKLLSNIKEELARLAGNGETALIQKERKLWNRFLENSYGKEFIDRGNFCMINWRKWKGILPTVEFVNSVEENEKSNDPNYRNRSKVSIKECTERLERDITLFDAWLSSMSNSGDLEGAIVDKVNKNSHTRADDSINKIWGELRDLEKKWNSKWGRMDILFERYDDGSLTGNLISKLNWGKWEKDRKEEEDRIKYLFEQKHRRPDGTHDYDGWSKLAKDIEFDSFKKPYMKVWHKGHSVFDLDLKQYVPAGTLDGYLNTEYFKILGEDSPKELRDWYTEYTMLKHSIDDVIGGHMPHHRAPLFTNGVANRVRNRSASIKNKKWRKPSMYGKAVWELVQEAFCKDEDLDPEMFGSAMTWNSLDEDPFKDEVEFEKDLSNRLTLFGINKLRDESKLSTDLIGTTLSYASMAYHYAANSLLVDILELGSSVLKERLVGSLFSESTYSGNKSRAYNRYLKYMEKQFYGISSKPVTMGKVVLNKVIKLASALASRMFLGWNVPGGIVNTGTGTMEIMKEAMAGEFFDLSNLRKALTTYFKSVPSNLMHSFNPTKNDRVSLFIRKFDVLNDNRRNQRTWRPKDNQALRFLCEDSALFPYSSGDHFMQTVPYLAVAYNTPLWDLNKKKTNLYEAYKVKDSEVTMIDGKTMTYKITPDLEMDLLYFRSAEDVDTYKILRDFKNILQEAVDKEVDVSIPLNLTDEMVNYVNSHGIKYIDYLDLLNKIKDDMNQLHWNIDDDSAFKDKSREINNRLHGIYNDMDKTMFHLLLVGEALLAMRGYVLGMVRRRFGTEQFSIPLSSESGGSYASFFKVLLATNTQGWNLGQALKCIALPFVNSREIEQMMLKQGFSKNDYCNMRRNVGDTLFALLCFLISRLAAKDDDEDEELKALIEERAKYLKEQGYTTAFISQWKDELLALLDEERVNLKGIAYYLSSRLFVELATWAYLPLTLTEYASFTNLTPSGLSALVTIGELAYYGYGALRYDAPLLDDTDYGYLKELGYSNSYIEDLKKAKKAEIEEAWNSYGKSYFYLKANYMHDKGDSKFWTLARRYILPWARTETLLYHPYEAYDSFEYGRTRTR